MAHQYLLKVEGAVESVGFQHAEPPRLYWRAKLSENCLLLSRHKRRRPRSGIHPSSALALRLAMEDRDDHHSEAAALTAIADKLCCLRDSLRTWIRQVQRDGGERPGLTSEDKARINEWERENRELRQANEILRKASAYCA